MQSFQNNRMERMEVMMRQLKEMMLQSVSVQLRGTNTTIEKMKGFGEDKYDKMNEKITTMERRLTMLEEPNTRERELKVNAEEFHKTQGDQNQ